MGRGSASKRILPLVAIAPTLTLAAQLTAVMGLVVTLKQDFVNTFLHAASCPVTNLLKFQYCTCPYRVVFTCLEALDLALSNGPNLPTAQTTAGNLLAALDAIADIWCRTHGVVPCTHTSQSTTSCIALFTQISQLREATASSV